ncbi:uncharacterized protein LOC136088730 [Hydra vulgaris]|uniref:Uncharacterized protein LOC136088730 n=1 Tax=Hydra vulgaris TaxID=6087 RepID=A0ABM4D4V1_HYDVU
MVGGSSCHANVKAILFMLMTIKLMAYYNMEGKHKKAFKKTNIRVITDSMTKDTIHKVHHSIGNILKRAPDKKDGGSRGGGKAVEEKDFFHNKSLRSHMSCFIYFYLCQSFYISQKKEKVKSQERFFTQNVIHYKYNR